MHPEVAVCGHGAVAQEPHPSWPQLSLHERGGTEGQLGWADSVSVMNTNVLWAGLALHCLILEYICFVYISTSFKNCLRHMP